MNQTIMDVTGLPDLVLGEEVVLLGEMGDQVVRAADRVPAGGSVYEITASLSPRLPRVYRNGEVAQGDARGVGGARSDGARSGLPSR